MQTTGDGAKMTGEIPCIAKEDHPTTGIQEGITQAKENCRTDRVPIKRILSSRRFCTHQH